MFLSFVSDLFGDDGIEKYTDDSKRLYSFCDSSGITLNNIKFDTSLAAYLLNPNSSDYSVSAYTDSTYATELASDAALSAGNTVIVRNDNGAIRYYTVAIAEPSNIYAGVKALTLTSATEKPVVTNNVAPVFGKETGDLVYKVVAPAYEAIYVGVASAHSVIVAIEHLILVY